MNRPIVEILWDLVETWNKYKNSKVQSHNLSPLLYNCFEPIGTSNAPAFYVWSKHKTSRNHLINLWPGKIMVNHKSHFTLFVKLSKPKTSAAM